METTQRQLKTIDDILALPNDDRVELIGGHFFSHPPPSPRHSCIKAALSLAIVSHTSRLEFEKNGGEKWRTLVEAWTLYDRHNAFVHDIAVFQKSKVPRLPDIGPIEAVPIWVCEILSPTSWSVDTDEKRHTLERYKVPYYWILDPSNNSILVLKYSELSMHYELGHYLNAKDGVKSLEPFEGLNINFADIFDI